ncbi:MAG TPA: hypothetical protein VLV78_10070 [Thermoanaerobaculia bacterium]|nr:hypothetical protein [Thermoanaerobaculia bacterium]
MLQDRIIWLALAFSTFIYALVLYLAVGQKSHASFDQSLSSPYTIVLYVMALGAFAAATAMSFITRNRPRRLRMIISMALYEASAIFGLMAAFLVADWRVYVAPWVVCLIGFARMFPSAEPAV